MQSGGGTLLYHAITMASNDVMKNQQGRKALIVLSDGVDFGSEDPAQSLPYLDVENPGPGDPSTRAALEVLTTLRPEIAGQVGRVAAPTAAAVTLTLTDGRVVVWGSTDRSQEKAEKLAALLTVPGRSYDVSSPELATVK